MRYMNSVTWRFIYSLAFLCTFDLVLSSSGTSPPSMLWDCYFENLLQPEVKVKIPKTPFFVIGNTVDLVIAKSNDMLHLAFQLWNHVVLS